VLERGDTDLGVAQLRMISCCCELCHSVAPTRIATVIKSAVMAVQKVLQVLICYP
jgi:hypothetical protein